MFTVSWRCPTRIPTKSTKVTPSETPKILIFPRMTPNAITNAYRKIACAIELLSIISSVNQLIKYLKSYSFIRKTAQNYCFISNIKLLWDIIFEPCRNVFPLFGCRLVFGCQTWLVANIVIIKSHRGKVFGLVNVPSVYYHIAGHGFFYHLPRWQAEFLPFRHHD